MTVSAALGFGHKIARRSHAPDEKVVKYGAPIGSATAEIRPGEHVHTQNLGSDYTATHTIDAARSASSRRDAPGNAGRILEGAASLDEVGEEIIDVILSVASGRRTRSEALGHQEFILTYKSFESIGPACLPL